MLILNPRTVTFGSAAWPDIASVVIDRSTPRPAIEWTDEGPHPTFADAPEQRTTIRVTQHIARDALDTPRPGESDTLRLHTAPAGADTPRARLEAACVVLDVTHELSLRNGAVRTIRLIAISPDGATDPIASHPADGID